MSNVDPSEYMKDKKQTPKFSLKNSSKLSQIKSSFLNASSIYSPIDAKKVDTLAAYRSQLKNLWIHTYIYKNKY